MPEREAPGRAKSPDRASLTQDGSRTSPPAVVGQRRTCLDLRSGSRYSAFWGFPLQPRLGARGSRAESRALCSVALAPQSPDGEPRPRNSFRFPEDRLVKPPGPAAHHPLRTLKSWVGWRTQTTLPERTLLWPGHLKQKRLCRLRALKCIL